MWPLHAAKNALKYSLIKGGLELTSNPLMHRLFPEAGGRGLIFTLHHVRPQQDKIFDPNDILSITPDFLEVSIRVALEQGLTPVHLHDLPDLLNNTTDKRNFVAFTLDDGYKNNAEFAVPIFRKFNIPYTIFISPGFVDRSRTIWWETAAALTREASSFRFDFGAGTETVQCQTYTEKFTAFQRLANLVQSINEDVAVQRIDNAARANQISPINIVDELIMSTSDIQSLASDPFAHFGAHTVNHINLKRATSIRLKQEVEDSISLLNQITGQTPRSFSYPYGWKTAVSERESNAIADVGIRVAVTTQPGILTSESLTQLTTLPRVSLNGRFQKRRYVKALISGIPFKLIK
ncbi:polysaccharide deacetylase family protein [Brucella pseudogrignonensis]|uniref:polysaccharide deacetylase family protein n=1 Tax=Brucella pseudogrignonensis TaxID=419475 RepID=UPI0028B99BC8|nr:polysaccharide deacetylase family protein [Brucella pseudogrignonensis]MDT6941313.1 polysaccharide deacetylase family protein [Brucella pseudogrignonensis]